MRWYSPAREIALCGHASLACGHVLFGSLERGDARDSIALRSRNSGILDLRRTEAAYELSLPAIKIEPSQLDEAVAALGGGPEEVFRSDLGYNIFVFAQEAQVRGLTPDFARLAALGDDQFICTAPGEASDIVSRVFVPGGGANEDSVTGSAHAALASYWTPRVGRERLTAYQASPRGGHLALRVGQDRVWLGGPCVTFGEGRFYL